MEIGTPLPHLRGRLTQARQYYPIDLIYRAAEDFANDRGTIYAAAVSYYVLFSLLPFIIFLTTSFGWFVRTPEIQDRVVDVVVAQLPPKVGLREEVTAVVANVSGRRSGWLGVVSLVATVWTASGMFRALRRALNHAFDVPVSHSFIHGPLIDVVSVLAVSLLAFSSVIITASFQFPKLFHSLLGLASNEVFNGSLIWLLNTALTLVLSFFVFLVVYRFIPNRTLDIRDVWIGALLAAVGFEMAKLGFGLYLTKVATIQWEIYGTLGGVTSFLVFVFVISNIVIFAAELASERAKDRAGL